MMLRYSAGADLPVRILGNSQKKFCFLCLLCSKTAVCRQRVMELLPKVDGVVQKMAESEQVLMGLQERRQRELWNLLKVACVSLCSPRRPVNRIELYSMILHPVNKITPTFCLVATAVDCVN